MNRRTIYITVLFTFLTFVWARDVSAQGVMLKIHSSKDSITLRWAPSSYLEWIRGIRYGYKVERFLVDKNNIVTGVSPAAVMHHETIKPLQETEWESVVRRDSVYAPVALQALWGETFELSSTFKTNVTELYNKVEENDSRFGFAMYCADRSPEVAKALGLYFVDKKISSNEKYIYRVFINAPISEAVDTAYALADPLQLSDLTYPSKPTGMQVGRSILLTWESTGTDYVGYHVERSENGKRFLRLTDDLVIPFMSKNRYLGYFSDTTLRKSGKYYYRIVGITPFKMQGPHSDMLEIMFSKTVEAPTQVFGFEEDKGVVVKWNYPNTEKELSHFGILRGRLSQGEYELVAANIKANLRTWTDASAERGGYYKVVAFSKSGERSESLEAFVQVKDETPPIPPVGLKGVVDSNGIVTLTWNPNPEKDMLGYRVFRGNSLKGEYAQVTQSVCSTNSFTDTITLKTLAKEVCYKLAAVDRRYNSSSYSESVVIIRPDIVPPAPPILLRAQSTSGSVSVEWRPSVSNDVRENLIYRVLACDTLLLAKVGLSTSSFEDTTTTGGSSFVGYFMVAVDSSGNKSVASNTISARYKISTKHASVLLECCLVKDGKPGISLRWKTSMAKRVLVYRKENTEDFRLFKVVAADNFTDYAVRQGCSYGYFLRVEYESGKFATSNTANVEVQ